MERLEQIDHLLDEANQDYVNFNMMFEQANEQLGDTLELCQKQFEQTLIKYNVDAYEFEEFLRDVGTIWKI